MTDEPKPGTEDDAYVLEETGETIEDIEDEMERTARQAAKNPPAAGAEAPAETADRARPLP